MAGGRWRGIAALVALAAAGCSSSKFDGTRLAVSSGVPSVTSGNTFSVLLQDASGHCPLSTSATITISSSSTVDSQTWPFSSCLWGSSAFLGNPSFTLQVADGSDRAEMVFADLVPGVDAMVTAPANGQVAAGANLTVSVPPAFAGQSPLIAEFVESPPADSYGEASTFPVLPAMGAGVQGSFDVPAPEHPASYTFIVLMEATADAPPAPGQIVSCTGFAGCSATTGAALGPMALTVTP